MSRKKRFLLSLLLSLPIMFFLTDAYSKLACLAIANTSIIKIIPCEDAGIVNTSLGLVEIVIHICAIYTLLTILNRIKSKKVKIISVVILLTILFGFSFAFKSEYCFFYKSYEKGELPYELGTNESYFGDNYCCPIGATCM